MTIKVGGSGGTSLEVGQLVTTVADSLGGFDLLDCDGSEFDGVAFPELATLLGKSISADSPITRNNVSTTTDMYNLPDEPDRYVSAKTNNDLYIYDITETSSIVKAYDSTQSADGDSKFYADSTSHVDKTDYDIYCLTGYGSTQQLRYQKSSNGGGIWSSPAAIGSLYYVNLDYSFFGCGKTTGKHLLIIHETNTYRFKKFTSDDGISWSSESTLSPTTTSNPISIFSASDDLETVAGFYQSTGESYLSLMLSSNGGSSFTYKPSSELPFEISSEGSVNVTPDGSTVIIGSHKTELGVTTIYKSTDFGGSWEEITLTLPKLDNQWDFPLLRDNTFGFSSDSKYAYVLSTCSLPEKYDDLDIEAYSLDVTKVDLLTGDCQYGNIRTSVSPHTPIAINPFVNVDGELYLSTTLGSDLTRVKISDVFATPLVSNHKIVAKESV